MKPSFLIVGANFINKGAEAMLKTVQFKLLEKYPEANIYAICHQEEEEIAHKNGILPVFIEKNILTKIIGKLKSVLRKLSGSSPIPYADYSPMDKIHRIPNFKMAIDISGFAYGDKRGYQQPLETVKVMEFCKQQGAKYIFMPQAWGAFKNQEVAANCKKMISIADDYFTRDDVSRKYVADLLEKEISEVPLLPDIAFHYPIPEIDGYSILDQNGYSNPKSQPLLGISPNMRIYERMQGKGADNKYVQLFVNLIHTLKQEYHIVLIPNEIRPPSDNIPDDAFLCATIYNLLNDKQNVTLIKGYRSAAEIKSVIREMEIVIASRFHSLIFALSLGIPCMAISWSHKYKELFKLFHLEKYVLEDEALDEQFVISTFREIQASLPEIKKNIETTLPQIKATNIHVFNLL
jgi:polysaccharide pyruvyl transferase WcaK-like protein